LSLLLSIAIILRPSLTRFVLDVSICYLLAEGGHFEVIMGLLTAKANVNAAAAEGGRLEVVERLLTAKADANAAAAEYNGGWTAL
jgi:hypothetical protein